MLNIQNLQNLNFVKTSSISPIPILSGAFKTSLPANTIMARATTASLSVFDESTFGSLTKYAKINEARFEGARRVENLAAATETPATQNITVVSGRSYQVSIGATSAVGSTAVCSGAFTGTLTGDATNRLAFTAPKTATTATLTVTITDAVTKLMVEDVTGQTNQNPSEYVSVGVLSGIYHGANVDGVKYFDTTNGNTVNIGTGVVTEATGSPIPEDTLVGYLAEGSRINRFLQSQDFSSASWTKTDTTISANNTTAPDGYLTADLITEGVAGTALVSQNTTITAGDIVYHSRILKRGNTDWVRLASFNGSDILRGWFNLATGQVGSATNSGTATLAKCLIKPMANGFYRCTLLGRVNAGSTTITNDTHSASADASTTRVNNATRYEWNADFFNEATNPNFSFPSSLIPTTTGTVTRGADSCQVDFGVGKFPQEFTLLMEYKPKYDHADVANSGGYLGIWATDDSRGASYEMRAEAGASYAVTAQTGSVLFTLLKSDFTQEQRTKLAFVVKQEGANTRCIIIKDGVEKLNTTVTLTLDHSNNGLLETGNYTTTRYAFGDVKNVKLYRQQLTTAQIQELMREYFTDELGNYLVDENGDRLYTYI